MNRLLYGTGDLWNSPFRTAFTVSTITANNFFSIADTRIQKRAAEAEALACFRTGFPGSRRIHGQYSIGKVVWDRCGAINRNDPVANVTWSDFNSVDFNDLCSQA